MDLVYNIFNTIVTSLKTVTEIENIYLGTRPNVQATEPTCFAVIELPYELEPTLYGSNEDEMQNLTTGIIYIYYKAKKDGTIQPQGMTQAVKKVRDLFPIVSDTCTCTTPRRLLAGYDGYGYHIASITFRIRTNPQTN